jgi:hypothetical protein
MRSVIERIVLGAVLVGVLGTLPLLSAGAETAAEVLSATGTAFAEGAEGQRSLSCQGLVGEGERIVTNQGSRVGLMAGDLYVQVEPGTSVTLGRTAAGAPSLEITSGRVRVVDTRAGEGPEFEIRTPDSRAVGRGNDTEVTVSQRGTELCEAAADLKVTKQDGSGSLAARPGQCVTAHGGEALAAAPRGESRIALSGAEGCIEVAAVDHFLPSVAAAPPPTIGLAPMDPERRTYGPCDNGSCTGFSPGSILGGGGGGGNGGGGFGFNTGPADRTRGGD